MFVSLLVCGLLQQSLTQGYSHKLFGLNIVHYVTVELIYLDSGLLRFCCVNNDLIFVGLTFGLMKLKLNTAHHNVLMSVDVMLLLVGLNSIMVL